MTNIPTRDPGNAGLPAAGDWKKHDRELPNDSALPGLVAIRKLGLARAIPALDLRDDPVELINRGYTEGSRITLEVRAGQRRFALKAYADNPSSEAFLYQSLTDAGLTRASGCCAPPLLLWEHELRMLAIGWLEGPSANELIQSGQGARAGELAAMWLRRVAELPIRIGPPFGVAAILGQQRRWVADLFAVDASLGAAAAAIADKLERTRPKTQDCSLVHGTLYTRHIFDLGKGPGVIDWQRFGQGPRELDAGIFLATAWRTKLRAESPELDVALAEESFLTGTAGLLDEHALAWHRSAMLLRLSSKVPRRKNGSACSERSHALLAEAGRFAIAG